RVAIRIRAVGFDLFQRPRGQEAGCGRYKSNATAIGQPGGHANHVLLGDADVDQPIRKGSLERVELARANRVVDDPHDAVVLVRQFGQGFDVRVATVEAWSVSYGDLGNRVGHA